MAILNPCADHLTDKTACHVGYRCSYCARQALCGAVFQLRSNIVGGNQFFYRQRVFEKNRHQIAESDSRNHIENTCQCACQQSQEVGKIAVFGHAFRITDKAAGSVIDVADFYRTLDTAVLNQRFAVNTSRKSACRVDRRILYPCVEQIGKRCLQVGRR